MTDSNTIPYEGRIALTIGWTLGWGTGAIRALVAMKGYEWFVADTFGIRPLGFIEAWGLFMLISFATMRPDTATDDRRPFESLVYSLILSLTVSGFAFVGLLILAAFL